MAKVIGIVRKIDPLGRIVIPKEIRRLLDIDIGDQMSISAVNSEVVIKKYTKSCVFCGSEEELIEYRNMCVCKKCRESLNK